MAGKRPAEQWYSGDWFRAVDVRKCTWAVRGIWREMLDIMVNEQEAGKIAGTPVEICRVLGCTKDELNAFFSANKAHKFANVTFRNGKVTIICRRLHRAFLEREGTKKRVRKYRQKEKRESNEEVTPYSSTSSSNTPYSPPNSFDIFWQSYPRKVGKGAARKVWAKIKPDQALVKKILAAIESQKESEQWLKENGRFIPHPTTWLNQERWEDEVEPMFNDPTDEEADATFARLSRRENVGND